MTAPLSNPYATLPTLALSSAFSDLLTAPSEKERRIKVKKGTPDRQFDETLDTVEIPREGISVEEVKIWLASTQNWPSEGRVLHIEEREQPDYSWEYVKSCTIHPVMAVMYSQQMQMTQMQNPGPSLWDKFWDVDPALVERWLVSGKTIFDMSPALALTAGKAKGAYLVGLNSVLRDEEVRLLKLENEERKKREEVLNQELADLRREKAEGRKETSEQSVQA